MFEKFKGSFRVAAFFLLLGACGTQIVRNATAQPVTVPVEKDQQKATREAKSRVGGADVRDTLPANGQGLVAGNGVVEPADRETRVASQVSAVVAEVLVIEGQKVKKGDVLVQLEDGVERAALRSAEADLAGERANYTRVQRGVRVEDKESVVADAQAAKSRADLSASILSRTEQLAKTNAATPDELERARRQAQTDQAVFRSTDARMRAAEAGSRVEEVSFQRARLLAAEARLAQAQAQLDRLSIRAPIDAEVLQVKVRKGELYSQSSDPLVVLGDTTKLRVRMDVDERDIARVAVGATAFVTADAFGDERFKGKVVEVGRRFGRKNIRTDDPIEKNDTKVLETVIELEATTRLVPGQRVNSFVTSS